MTIPADRDIIKAARGTVDYFTENIKFFEEGEVFIDHITEPDKPRVYIKYAGNVEELF